MEPKEFFQYQRETNAEMFNHGLGYIQGLVVVAYAGFFVLWDQAKDMANPGLWALAGLFLTISLGFYTAWEVFAFLFRQRLMMDMAKAITEGEAIPSVEVYLEAAGKMRTGLRQFVRNFRYWWRGAMFCILAPLLGAWLLIGSVFVIRFLRTIAAWN